MREIVGARRDVRPRGVGARFDAVNHFKGLGEDYKAELIAAIPGDEPISIYKQGDWLDLCRGPHLPSTGHVGKGFKLLNVAGAYWRGDSRNPMLQRIYGTAWRDEKELKAYLDMLEEAEKRDHRRLGREMDLYHFQEEAVGSAFWHPKGWVLWRAIEGYMRARLEAAGYVEVRTPQLYDRALWEASGHWEKFHEHMFTTETEDERVLAVKPMNCPGHVQIFRQGIKSYRDLPLRMAEFGSCHRYEPSGRAARADAGARLHPGRRAHLLHRGPDHVGDAGFLRPAARHLPRFRLHRRRRQVLRPAARPRRRRRDLGPRRGGAGRAR